MKTRSKVKNVQGNGTWNGKDGTLFYRYDYVMEDGVALQASHKTTDLFKVGDEVDYEVTRENQYGKSGNVSKPSDYRPATGKLNGSKGNQASFALAYAKDLAVGGVIKVEEVLDHAGKFNEWLKSN
ncbi:MAG: hypothetical protein AAF600_13065 [Bacteroidota bacterium]